MRIAGIDIPDNKRGEIALTYIFGLGRSSAIKILNAAGISVDKKVSEWTEDCLLYTSPSPRDGLLSRMPSSA